MVKWPFQRSSDLQLGDKKVTLNCLECVWNPLTSLISLSEADWAWHVRQRNNSILFSINLHHKKILHAEGTPETWLSLRIDPSKMAILRTYTPLLYRFPPFYWRVQGFLGWFYSVGTWFFLNQPDLRCARCLLDSYVCGESCTDKSCTLQRQCPKTFTF